MWCPERYSVVLKTVVATVTTFASWSYRKCTYCCVMSRTLSFWSPGSVDKLYMMPRLLLCRFEDHGCNSVHLLLKVYKIVLYAMSRTMLSFRRPRPRSFPYHYWGCTYCYVMPRTISYRLEVRATPMSHYTESVHTTECPELKLCHF